MAEIFDVGELERWLRTQPRDVLGVIAIRSALRVLPTLLFLDRAMWGYEWGKVLSDVVLPVFRATALPLAAVRYPTRGNKLAAAAAAAAAATVSAKSIAEGDASAHRSALTHTVAPDTALDFVFAAADAVDAVAHAVEAVFRTATSATSATSASSAASAAALAIDVADPTIARTTGIADAHKAFVIALHRDREFLRNGSAHELARQSLWQDGEAVSILSLWKDFSDLLNRGRSDWGVWTRWYEAVLIGASTPGGEELDFYRVLLDSEDDWKESPGYVNALINLKEEEIARRRHPDEKGSAPEVPKPRLAALYPILDNGRIVLPNMALTGIWD